MVRKSRGRITPEILKIVLSMANENHRITEIAKTLNLHRKTVGDLIKKYAEGVPFKTSSEKFRETCRRKRTSIDRVDSIIHNSISCNNSLVLDELKDVILEKLGTTVSRSSISRKLKKMEITRKRLVLVSKERNTTERLNERAIYATNIDRFSDDQLVFLDETGFSEDIRRTYGYSNKNSPLI